MLPIIVINIFSHTGLIASSYLLYGQKKSVETFSIEEDSHLYHRQQVICSREYKGTRIGGGSWRRRVWYCQWFNTWGILSLVACSMGKVLWVRSLLGPIWGKMLHSQLHLDQGPDTWRLVFKFLCTMNFTARLVNKHRISAKFESPCVSAIEYHSPQSHLITTTQRNFAL